MLDAHHDQLRVLCQRYGVRRLELFGSATRGDFNPDTSDYDFFVDFGDQPVAGSFKRYMGLKFDLEALLGRPVDLVERDAVTNPYFLRATADRREVYAA
jgi:predicted nucleotidyltransferase